ncbi:MAG: PQQ-binding-like beta-propeller repeat protein [Phycisphaeraceae bacterium]
MTRFKLSAALLLVFILGLSALAAVGSPGDWPRWRGPNLDDISTEKGLLQAWPKAGPKLLWTAKRLGPGYSSIAIVGDRIYTMGAHRDAKGGVGIVCINRENGEVLWTNFVGNGNEPNCTPTVDPEAGLVFGLTKDGDFLCADAKTGEAKWRKNFKKDFGGKMHSGWGYSESPLIDGDRVIVTPGAKEAQIVALNKTTGELVWKSEVPDLGKKGNDGAGYSSIVIGTIGGVKQYIQLVGRGVIGVQASDGKFLWNYNKVANGTANIPTPIVKDDFVFCTSGYGDGGSALLKITKKGNSFEATEVYYKSSRELQNHHGGVIMIGNFIFGGHGHNKGMPFCLEWKTGKVKWLNEDNEIQGQKSAAVTFADGHLYFRYEDGTVTLVEANPNAYREKGSFKLPGVKGPSWPHPVVAGGRLYLRNQDELLCYDVKK